MIDTVRGPYTERDLANRAKAGKTRFYETKRCGKFFYSIQLNYLCRR